MLQIGTFLSESNPSTSGEGIKRDNFFLKKSTIFSLLLQKGCNIFKLLGVSPVHFKLKKTILPTDCLKFLLLAVMIILIV